MSRMKVAATKAMCQKINQKFQQIGNGYRAIPLTMTEEEYYIHIGSFDRPELDKIGWDKYRAIQIVYPDEDYALPKFVTTRILIDLCNAVKAATIEELLQAVVEAYEI